MEYTHSALVGSHTVIYGLIKTHFSPVPVTPYGHVEIRLFGAWYGYWIKN